MIKGAVMNEHKKHGSSFSSKMGFILAAAGSAVGLGNLWRFPYLAAKYGGGSFLLIYVILAVTFGFALMITEIALGRKTGKSALYAFSTLHEKCGFIGILASIVPIIILPYYCVIGGGLAIGQKADQFSVMTYVLDAKSFAVTGGEFGMEASVISLVGYIIVTGVAFFGNKELCDIIYKKE